MTRKLLLVGEDYGDRFPESLCVDAHALTGKSGQFFAALAGLELEEYKQLFERTNVVARPSDWLDRETVEHGLASVIVKMLLSNRLGNETRVIALGRKTSDALGLSSLSLLAWTTWSPSVDDIVIKADIKISKMPHPSGRNRWWNTQSHRVQAQAFLEETVRWARS